MIKKLKSGLAPLLVIAACVMTPAPALGSPEIVWPSCVAPNCPHVYKNGIIGAEGKPVRDIGWGVLKFSNAAPGLAEAQCHSIWGGFLENPVGGGRAEGKVGGFYPYECTAPPCVGIGGEYRAAPGKTLEVGWKAEIVENGAKEFFQKTGFKGVTENVKATTAGQAEIILTCTATTIEAFFGVNYTKILNNGISIGSAPGESTMQREAVNPANMRNFESELHGPLETETLPSLKVEGFGSEELIEVKNP